MEDKQRGGGGERERGRERGGGRERARESSVPSAKMYQNISFMLDE